MVLLFSKFLLIFVISLTKIGTNIDFYDNFFFKGNFVFFLVYLFILFFLTFFKMDIKEKLRLMRCKTNLYKL